MRKIIMLLLGVAMLSSCAELRQVVTQLPGSAITNTEIAGGLKEALNMGVKKQVNKLTREDGFLGNEQVKILLPEALENVDNTLRKVGLGALIDEGIKLLNRAAEDAVKDATPIFVNAITGITFTDARNILLGNTSAATDYLKDRTANLLYDKFSPVIYKALKKVGATETWATIITKYNNLPLTKNVDPDLVNYVTLEALEGVYLMIAVEEKAIRSTISSRTTPLLKKVFALQD